MNWSLFLKAIVTADGFTLAYPMTEHYAVCLSSLLDLCSAQPEN